MKSKRLALTLLIFSLPAGLMAQGSGSVSRPTRTGGYDSAPFAVTRSVKGTIAEIQAEKGVVVVQEKNGKRHVLKVGEKTEFKAGKKKPRWRGKSTFPSLISNWGSPLRLPTWPLT